MIFIYTALRLFPTHTHIYLFLLNCATSFIKCCLYVWCYPNVTNGNKWILYCIVLYQCEPVCVREFIRVLSSMVMHLNSHTGKQTTQNKKNISCHLMFFSVFRPAKSRVDNPTSALTNYNPALNSSIRNTARRKRLTNLNGLKPARCYDCCNLVFMGCRKKRLNRLSPTLHVIAI